jgi:hypothetical protein
MATKNCTSKVGLSRFPNNAHEAFLLTNREISKENDNIQEQKMYIAILSKVDQSIHFF